MKFAYLIMAHNEPYVLEKLIRMLDYPDNDIYIHIDEKSQLINKDALYEYYGAAEPPVRCGESHLSGLTEPPHFVY